jgi:catechol 2,3-dioxygenase-like lactoylglutathione lyase family enzyme
MIDIIALDHVQIAVPPDSEAAARAFYLDLLGFREIERPVTGAGRSFLWVAAGDQQMHVPTRNSARHSSPTRASSSADLRTSLHGWRPPVMR